MRVPCVAYPFQAVTDQHGMLMSQQHSLPPTFIREFELERIRQRRKRVTSDVSTDTRWRALQRRREWMVFLHRELTIWCRAPVSVRAREPRPCFPSSHSPPLFSLTLIPSILRHLDPTCFVRLRATRSSRRCYPRFRAVAVLADCYSY